MSADKQEETTALTLSREVLAALPKVVSTRVSRGELFTIAFAQVKERLEREIAAHQAAEQEARLRSEAAVTEAVVLKLVKKASKDALYRSSTVDRGCRWMDNKSVNLLEVRLCVHLPENHAHLMPKAWQEAQKTVVRERAAYREKARLLRDLTKMKSQLKRTMLERTLNATPEGQLVLQHLDTLVMVYQKTASTSTSAKEGTQ